MYTSCFRSCRNYLRSEEGDNNASNRYDRDRRCAAGIAGEGTKAGIWNPFLTSLAGLVLVLFWLVPYIYDLFETMKNLFAL